MSERLSALRILYSPSGIRQCAAVVDKKGMQRFAGGIQLSALSSSRINLQPSGTVTDQSVSKEELTAEGSDELSAKPAKVEEKAEPKKTASKKEGC